MARAFTAGRGPRKPPEPPLERQVARWYRPPMRFLPAAVAALLLLLPAPAFAAVIVTFWSHEFGNQFPHAFITLRGRPDAGGATVDLNYGFTAKSIGPSILWKTVAGRLDVETPAYVAGSDAQFAVVATDAEYAAILRLLAAWDERTGDARYNLKTRNCIHFVGEAARRLGLAGTEQPGLMKKPQAYLLAVEAANRGRVIAINRRGADYLAHLSPIAAAPQSQVPRPRDAAGATAAPARPR